MRSSKNKTRLCSSKFTGIYTCECRWRRRRRRVLSVLRQHFPSGGANVVIVKHQTRSQMNLHVSEATFTRDESRAGNRAVKLPHHRESRFLLVRSDSALMTLTAALFCASDTVSHDAGHDTDMRRKPPHPPTGKPEWRRVTRTATSGRWSGWNVPTVNY